MGIKGGLRFGLKNVDTINPWLSPNPLGCAPPFLRHAFDVSYIGESLNLFEGLFTQAPIVENVWPEHLR